MVNPWKGVSRLCGKKKSKTGKETKTAATSARAANTTPTTATTPTTTTGTPLIDPYSSNPYDAASPFTTNPHTTAATTEGALSEMPPDPSNPYGVTSPFTSNPHAAATEGGALSEMRPDPSTRGKGICPSDSEATDSASSDCATSEAGRPTAITPPLAEGAKTPSKDTKRGNSSATAPGRTRGNMWADSASVPSESEDSSTEGGCESRPEMDAAWPVMDLAQKSPTSGMETEAMRRIDSGGSTSDVVLQFNAIDQLFDYCAAPERKTIVIYEILK